jgi:hypothetical protein
MSTFRRQWTVGILAAWVALGLSVVEARAQFRAGMRPSANVRGLGVPLPAANQQLYAFGPRTGGFGGGYADVSCSPSRASFFQSPPNGYGNAYGGYPYGQSYEDSYGGYLRGSADTINSQGQFRMDQQQAHLLRATARMEQIDNRRRAFDEWIYERNNTPTLEDERERSQQQELRRSLNDPPVTEVLSAKALNDLLVNLQTLQAKGASGPPVQLADGVLDRINVTAGRSGGHVGVLKNGGRLHWPAALSGKVYQAEREELADLTLTAVQQVRSGAVNAALLKEMIRTVDRFQKDLARRATNLPPTQYREAKRFLTDLDDALTALRQPDAGEYFTGKYIAKGKTIPELVQHMTRQGLRFAPAVAGDEAAYAALHRALVTYDTSAQGQVVAQR